MNFRAPCINQFVVSADDAIPTRSRFVVNDGKQTLAYSLRLFEIDATADYSVKDQWGLVAEIENFNREGLFTGHPTAPTKSQRRCL
jgi:hypothetical protein